MPVRALVEAGAIFGIEENNIRVSLARLIASDRIERDERGRYRLGQAVAAISRQLRNWRHLDARMRPWDGHWLVAHTPRVGRGPARRRRERSLELLGFRELESGFSFRPDNLLGGVNDVRNELVGLVSGTAAEPNVLGRVFRVRDLDAASEREVRSLWDTDSITNEVREASLALHDSESRINTLSNDEAMIESFLVGGRILRILVRHPLLPAEILTPAPLTQLISGMQHYDQLGRMAWAAFLARHEVPHRALPLDSRQPTPGLIPATQLALP